MKGSKVTFLMILLLGFGIPGVLAARVTESPLYARTVVVQRIFPHERGYMVVYRANSRENHTVYLPIEWFSQIENRDNPEGMRGELAFGRGAEYPYMVIYWREGVFHHVRLAIDPTPTHPSWGTIPGNIDVTDRFQPDADPVFPF